MGENQDERESYLGEIEREDGEERVDSTVKESRYQEGEEGQAKRVSLGEVEESTSG